MFGPQHALPRLRELNTIADHICFPPPPASLHRPEGSEHYYNAGGKQTS